MSYHDCPECGGPCYCDLDDSNDCRDNGECYHRCDPADLRDPDGIDDLDEEGDHV